MDPFTIDFSAPVDPAGFTGGLGGPDSGGHVPPNWYIQYGMDLGASMGTQVFAAFDGHITKFQPHDPGSDTPKVYGAQIFVRAPNDGMGGFYTHLTNTPDGIAPGAFITRGDLLGEVYEVSPTAAHLHLALVEIIGGVPAGGSAPTSAYHGVNLYDQFRTLEAGDGSDILTVLFNEDGSAPTIP